MIKSITNLNKEHIKFSSAPSDFIGLSCICRHGDVTLVVQVVHNNYRTTD